MSRESVLALGRSRVEASFTETIEAGPYTETVGEHLEKVRTMTATHYSGAATIEYPTLTVSESAAGGQQLAAADIVVKVPVTAVLAPGDIVTVATSSVDDTLVGHEYRVKGEAQSGQVVCHRYPVEELT